eukprot:3503307-Heterocapsa_arctica.AAC.1
MAWASSAIQGTGLAESCRISQTVGHATAILRASLPRRVILLASVTGLPLSNALACASSRSEGCGRRSVITYQSS